MKVINENNLLDIHVEPSDWRYSAAIYGLYQYLTFWNAEFELSDEVLKFKSQDITEEKILNFAESVYHNDMYHTRIADILSQKELSEEQYKLVNELLKGNSVMKRVFGKIQCNEENHEQILSMVEINREDLARETFRNKANMYANFANTGQLFQGGKGCCRLLGYYVDGGKKGKSIAYNFDTNTYVAEDDSIFDFIPFGFYGNRDAFFINDNFKLQRLIIKNKMLKNLAEGDIEKDQKSSSDVRKILFRSIKEVAEFINYDVEVIVKSRNSSYFESMYIRKESIAVLKGIQNYDSFCFSLKINDNYYINIQKKVVECILNLLRLDELIEIFLKRDNSSYLVGQFIDLNLIISGGGNEMKESMRGAYACAKAVAKKLPDNKRDSYRQKLTSAIVFKDYDRVCEILLQLSNYADISFGFAYQLFEDFENNKDVAYTFINALDRKNESGNQKNKNETN